MQQLSIIKVINPVSDLSASIDQREGKIIIIIIIIIIILIIIIII